MAEHHISYAWNAGRVTAICSCGRWRSNSYLSRSDAEDKGLAHMVRGDQQNRAAAQFNRSDRVRLDSELKWYIECSQDMLRPKKERDQWKALADELRRRIATKTSEEDEPTLF